MKINLLILFIATFTISSCTSKEKPMEEEIIVEKVELEPKIQILEPVLWEYTTEKLRENEYKITFNATIDNHWYVYSSTIKGDGPVPTSINYDENAAIVKLSEITESGEITKDGYDEMFELDIKKFGQAATFSQVIKTNGTTNITGYLEYMTCDSIQCLFPDPVEFSFEAK